MIRKGTITQNMQMQWGLKVHMKIDCEPYRMLSISANNKLGSYNLSFLRVFTQNTTNGQCNGHAIFSMWLTSNVWSSFCICIGIYLSFTISLQNQRRRKHEIGSRWFIATLSLNRTNKSVEWHRQYKFCCLLETSLKTTDQLSKPRKISIEIRKSSPKLYDFSFTQGINLIIKSPVGDD